MLQQLAKHIDEQFSFLKEKKLLIAISGGVDSVVLTHLLHQLQFNTSLAHCNFQLRGKESDLDELFIKELGKSLNIQTFTTRFNTNEYTTKNKLSTQLAARELRYSWFDSLSKENNFDYILTAHHADDNLETFLINLSRGTGLEGLTGIPSINKNIIRPLLIFSREEIITFAKKNNIEWREDESNSETKYLRNKIRHQIVPTLKELNDSVLKNFNKTIDHLKESQQIIDDKIADITHEIVSKEGDLLKINIEKLLKLSNPKAYLYQLLKSYKFTEWNDVYNLIYAQSGKQILTKFYTLLKDRDFLLLLRTNEKSSFEKEYFIIREENKEITAPIKLQLKKVLKKTNINKENIYVDYELLNFPLKLRRWKSGDFFYPKGMIGRKKVSKYFKDEKISIVNKNKIWLLCSSKNEVIWIVGKRQDRRFLPTEKTTKLLKISI
ncbi:tRNA lysidine(34) synthetase TilS [Tenacibaculum singaporense]|uniref:tRNA(Ile)-lysidine synthase n=1 Tax=Tenacibaculum singaporense TaxID=2358479 RepID=A0A3Q8RQP6_9FLAO|nr:tRNA lysidine(34) synthetase TilS [Tenacibaculum singaporense]AZJ34811.1 tRNA lysidine(34) synthetase TilS [Tenacibaculum singaporense]